VTEDHPSNDSIITAQYQPDFGRQWIVTAAAFALVGAAFAIYITLGQGLAAGMGIGIIVAAAVIVFGCIGWSLHWNSLGRQVVLDEAARTITFLRAQRIRGSAFTVEFIVPFEQVTAVKRKVRRGGVWIIVYGTDSQGREVSARIDETFDRVGELWWAMQRVFRERASPRSSSFI
jgi:hypothetical protein